VDWNERTRRSVELTLMLALGIVASDLLGLLLFGKPFDPWMTLGKVALAPLLLFPMVWGLAPWIFRKR
jgi:hypothetical protein